MNAVDGPIEYATPDARPQKSRLRFFVYPMVAFIVSGMVYVMWFAFTFLFRAE